MVRIKTISKAYLIYFVGTAFSRFIGILLLPLFTRYLSQTDYGYLEIIQSTVLLLAPVFTLQMEQGILRFAIGKEEDERKRIITSTSFLLLVVLLICFLLIQILKDFTDIGYIDIATAFLYFYVINQFFLYVLRALNMRGMFSFGNFLYGISIAIINLIFFFFDEINLKNVLLSYTIGNIIVVIVFFIKLNFVQYLKWENYDFKKLMAIVKYSIPLLADAVSWWVMNLSDRFLIKYFMDFDEVGIYAVAYKFSAALIFANIIFYMVWQEESIKNAGLKKQSDDNAGLFNNFMRIQFSVFLLMIPLTKIYILHFIGSGFHSALNYTPFLIGGAVFASFSSFYGMKYQVEKKTNLALYTALFGSLLNIGLNIILIPMYGLWGATISTLVAFAALWGVRIIKSDSFITFKKVDWLFFIIGIVFCVIFTYITFLFNSIVLFGILAGVVILSVYLNKGLITELKKRR